MNAIGVTVAGSTMAVHMQYVLVFVPEGLGVHDIAVSANPNVAESIYEPHQYVISQGIFDSVNSLPVRNRLARNLQAEDQIFMAIHSAQTVPAGDKLVLWGNCNFAITY
jgi:hypothetical protein